MVSEGFMKKIKLMNQFMRLFCWFFAEENTNS